jgi:SAM-dependent methyltransferase
MDKTKLGNQKTYNAIAAKYEENFGNIPPSHEYVEYILEKIQNIQRPHILDLGCGTGTILSLFLKGSPNAKLIGVDFSQELLKIAKKKVEKANFICQDFANYQPEMKFDVVVATFSLIHSNNEELELMIPKIYSWLNEGGFFYPSFILGEGEAIQAEALAPNHQTYFNYVSEANLKKLFVINRFNIVKQKIVRSENEYEAEDDIYFVLQK